MASVITLTTDFGVGDVYVANVKGVILSINPDAIVVDICHDIAPQNIFQAAFVLSAVYQYFPRNSIHIVIVDPGVGSQRKAVLLKTPWAYFVAPDNGVLSYIIDEIAQEPLKWQRSQISDMKQRKLNDLAEAIAIVNPDYYRHPVSSTFHGRDIFAPVAAYLSKGVPLYKMGKKIESLHAFVIPKPEIKAGGKLAGEILNIDRFGNLITNIKASDLLGENVIVEISNHVIKGLSTYYAEKKGLLAIVGGSGYLEIALSNDSAAAYLKCNVGDQLMVIVKQH